MTPVLLLPLSLLFHWSLKPLRAASLIMNVLNVRFTDVMFLATESKYCNYLALRAICSFLFAKALCEVLKKIAPKTLRSILCIGCSYRNLNINVGAEIAGGVINASFDRNIINSCEVFPGSSFSYMRTRCSLSPFFGNSNLASALVWKFLRLNHHIMNPKQKWVAAL